jgi:hypothetical protein
MMRLRMRRKLWLLGRWMWEGMFLLSRFPYYVGGCEVKIEGALREI